MHLCFAKVICQDRPARIAFAVCLVAHLLIVMSNVVAYVRPLHAYDVNSGGINYSGEVFFRKSTLTAVPESPDVEGLSSTVHEELLFSSVDSCGDLVFSFNIALALMTFGLGSQLVAIVGLTADFLRIRIGVLQLISTVSEVLSVILLAVSWSIVTAWLDSTDGWCSGESLSSSSSLTGSKANIRGRSGMHPSSRLSVGKRNLLSPPSNMTMRDLGFDMSLGSLALVGGWALALLTLIAKNFVLHSWLKRSHSSDHGGADFSKSAGGGVIVEMETVPTMRGSPVLVKDALPSFVV